MYSWTGDLNYEKLLWEWNIVKIQFSIEEIQKGMGKKFPITWGVKYIFLLTFSVAKCVSSLSKKIIFKEIMFTADPREKPCWIRLNGKIIPQDTIGISLAQGIHNGVGNLSPQGPWFHSGSEWESKKVINIGWNGEWPSWSQLKWQARIPAANTGRIWSHKMAGGITRLLPSAWAQLNLEDCIPQGAPPWWVPPASSSCFVN